MRKLLIGLLAMGLLSGCGQTQSTQQTLDIFAAASLTTPLDAVIALYQEDHPDVDISVTYDSSGTLKRQIEEGAPCDVFISASWTQVEALELEGTAWLSNQLVLIVPQGEATITGFDDLISGGFTLFGIGNSDVPAGVYGMEVLESLDISLADLEAQGKVSYGSNVKEILVQTEQSMVDCAMVYATDAVGSAVDVVAVADQTWYSPAIYPIATLNENQATQDFATFLQGDPAMDILLDAGFSPAA